MADSKERTLSTAARKAAVLVMYGTYGVAVALWVAAGGLRPLPIAILIVALLLLSLGALFVLFQGTHYWKWGNSPDADLDEFQVASRNAAYKSAYVIVASLTLLVLLLGRIASDATDVAAISESAREFMFWGWFMLVLTLPAALLAWTEKPLDDDGVVAARR